MSNEPAGGNQAATNAIKKSRQAADGGYAFSIIAMVFGIISLSQHVLGAAAIAMGAAGLVFAWRGNPVNGDDAANEVRARDRKWRQTAVAFASIGIVLGAVGVVQNLTS
ncbi:hypothetical protein [Demequina aurantiaca]|uniref:hypothetical protein n=1 Tax=Demequina aurantiaca TaxID=676200 RepID=UPI0007843F4C|nr:hypothetical protein [Demequina aurantiaca]